MLSQRFLPLLAATAMVTAACGVTSDAGPESGTAAVLESQSQLADDASTAGANDAIETGVVGDGEDASVVASQGVGDVSAPVDDDAVFNGIDLGESRRTARALDPPLEAVVTNSGPATQLAQWRLLELGFWVQEASGEYGITTTQAVMAFQKYHGLTADGVLGPVTAAKLSEAIERPVGRSNTGTLVEVDKSKQLVYVIRDGTTQWVLNASTGSEVPYEEEDQNTPDEIQVGDSVTRTGLFEVYREREEGWWEGDLGEIYRPKYFDYGIALHGSNSVPNYPASHGCVRLSIPAMDWIWDNDVVPKGTPVWVHGELAEEFQYDPDAEDDTESASG